MKFEGFRASEDVFIRTGYDDLPALQQRALCSANLAKELAEERRVPLTDAARPSRSETLARHCVDRDKRP